MLEEEDLMTIFTSTDSEVGIVSPATLFHAYSDRPGGTYEEIGKFLKCIVIAEDRF